MLVVKMMLIIWTGDQDEDEDVDQVEFTSTIILLYRKVPSKRPLHSIRPPPIFGLKSCMGSSLYIVNAHPAGALCMTLYR